MNEEKFKKYLGIANHDIQVANDTMELKSYVASILYEIDNLQSKIDKAIEWIEQYEKQIGETSKSIVLTDDVVIGNLLDILKEDK